MHPQHPVFSNSYFSLPKNTIFFYLAPVQYTKDCTATVERTLGHELKSLKEFNALRGETKIRWEKKYPGVPFDVNLKHLESHPEELGKEASTLTYDIAAAASR